MRGLGAFSNDDVDEPTRDDDDPLHRLVAELLLHKIEGQDDSFDGTLVRGFGHAHRAALDTVHLHHQLDLVLLRSDLWPSCFFTKSRARTIASMARWSADLGTRTVPRLTPFTCTTSSISSCSSAAGSGSGHGAVMMSSPNWSSRHRWWVMCGAIGESSLSRTESPSSVVAFQ